MINIVNLRMAGSLNLPENNISIFSVADMYSFIIIFAKLRVF